MDLAEWLDKLRPSWMSSGVCTPEDGGLFFPAPGRGNKTVHQSQAQAAKICADCPVRVECLEYALANNIDHGVWGGESERARRRMRRQRRIAA